MKKTQLLTRHRITLAIIASCMAITIFTWGFMAFTKVPTTTPLTWQPAQKVVESAWLQRILKQNFQPINNELLPAPDGVKVVTVAAEKRYFVFDFNTPKLCGVAGCLYSAYTTDGNNLLSLILNPQLPNKFNLLVQSSEKRNGYPCLDVFQKSSNELVVNSHFCFESGRLVLLNQSLNEVKS